MKTKIPIDFNCPACGHDLSSFLVRVCPRVMGARGRGKAKARTSEQARAAVAVRWAKVRAGKEGLS